MSSSVDSQNDPHQFPEAFRIAQDAVETEEVKQIIKRLADFNLGVFMPHMHVPGPDGNLDRLAEMPSGTVQVERDLVNTFVPASAATDPGLIAVGWRYKDGAIVCSNRCPHD